MYYVEYENGVPYKITVTDTKIVGEGINLPSLPIDLETTNDFEKIDNNIYIRKGVN